MVGDQNCVAADTWVIDLETRYIMFGPGVSTIPSSTAAMPSSAGMLIAMFMCRTLFESQYAGQTALAQRQATYIDIEPRLLPGGTVQ